MVCRDSWRAFSVRNYLLILTVMLFAAGCAGDLNQASNQDLPVPGGEAEVASGCRAQSLTGVGSELCSQLDIAPSSKSLGLYSQALGIDDSGGLGLNITVVSSIPGITGGDFFLPLTEAGSQNKLVLTRDDDGCPDGFAGIRQGFEIFPETDLQDLLDPDAVDSFLEILSSLTGCDFQEPLNEEQVRFCANSKDETIKFDFLRGMVLLISSLNDHLANHLLFGSDQGFIVDLLGRDFSPEELALCAIW